MSKKEVNFKCLGSTLLIKPIATKSVLDLSMMKEYPLGMQVMAIGDEVTKVKVGDEVICVGNYLTLNVDGEAYHQVYESSVMGVVLNGASVTIDNPEPKSQV
jgi:hypothetical protein